MGNTLKDQLDTVRDLVDSLYDDVEKNDDGVLAAGGRVRKQLQEVKRLAQAARVFCLERDHTRKDASKPK